MANVYFFGKKNKTGNCNFLNFNRTSLWSYSRAWPWYFTVDGGVENLIKALDNLYLKDRNYSAYGAYETFENSSAHLPWQ